ncbi:unnamed protein product [Peniophora sp. CBMAI 1063]|nr:unnamed protein product [Peniophora sp. CBMAI 1063]
MSAAAALPSSSIAGFPAPATASGFPAGSVPSGAAPISGSVNVLTWQGSSLFSLVFSTYLFGIITHQVITYRAQARGEKLLRCWVYWLWALVATGTSIDIYNCWTVVQSIEMYLLKGAGVSIADAVVGSTAEMLVQLYFIRGIWKVRKELYPDSKITLAMCGTYVLLAFASMATWILSMAFSVGVFDLTKIQEVITIKLSLAIILDLCITFDLVVLLRNNTSEFPSYKRRGENRFEALIIFLVSRGTALVATQIVALTLTYTVDLISGIIMITSCLPKIYVWSMLLVILNREGRHTSMQASELYRSRSIPLPELDSVVIESESFEQTRSYEAHPLGPVRTRTRTSNTSSHEKPDGAQDVYST